MVVGAQPGTGYSGLIVTKPSTASVFLKVIGFMVLLIGTLNVMLAWKGGFVGSDFQMVLIGGGLIMMVMGAVAGQRAESSKSSDPGQ
jgi:hypothetical protein